MNNSKKYSENPTICPFCGASLSLSPGAEDGMIITANFCEDCNTEWEDQYKLIGYKEL